MKLKYTKTGNKLIGGQARNRMRNWSTGASVDHTYRLAWLTEDVTVPVSDTAIQKGKGHAGDCDSCVVAQAFIEAGFKPMIAGKLGYFVLDSEKIVVRGVHPKREEMLINANYDKGAKVDWPATVTVYATPASQRNRDYNRGGGHQGGRERKPSGIRKL